MRNAPRPFAMLLAMILVAGCSKEVQTSDLDIEFIDHEALAAAIDAEQVVLVDVRRPERYQAGHIPRAINLPINFMRPDDPRLVDREMIVVYGTGNDADLVKAGAKKLRRLRYENIHAYLDGVRFWESSGRPLMRGSDVQGRPDYER